jgi:hypothetical protein
MREKLLLVFAHTEEIRLFLELISRPTAVRTVAVEQVGLGPEGLAWCAIPIFILTEVNISLGLNVAEDLLNGQLVALLRCPDEIGIRDVELVPERLEAFNYAIGELKGSFSLGLSRFLDFLTVLIGTGQKADLITACALVASQPLT